MKTSSPSGEREKKREKKEKRVHNSAYLSSLQGEQLELELSRYSFNYSKMRNVESFLSSIDGDKDRAINGVQFS